MAVQDSLLPLSIISSSDPGNVLLYKIEELQPAFVLLLDFPLEHFSTAV